jgi:hypothetical protein
LIVHTEVYTSIPTWLSLVRPQPEDQVIEVRRDCQIVLDINLRELSPVPGQGPVTRKSLVIPSTASVKAEEYYNESDVVHLSVQVFGAHTQSECKYVCRMCSNRDGKKKGNPSLVDFYAANNVIKASDDGLVQVKFKFSCYPKHQGPGENAYL